MRLSALAIRNAKSREEPYKLGDGGGLCVSERLSSDLTGEVGKYIPVVDSISSAVLDAVAFARLGLSHSKLTFIDPPARTRESILAIR